MEQKEFWNAITVRLMSIYRMHSGFVFILLNLQGAGIFGSEKVILSEAFKDYHRCTGEGEGREYLQRWGEVHR